MRRKLTYTLIIALLICLAGFFANSYVASIKVNTKYAFAIYLVDGLSLKDSLNMDISKISLENEPLITEEDITGYGWSSHKIELKKGVKVSAKLDEKVNKVAKLLIPFVIVCNNERIYVGSFVSLLSSYLPECPTITSTPSLRQEFLEIKQYGDKNTRADKRIYESLAKAGLLE